MASFTVQCNKKLILLLLVFSIISWIYLIKTPSHINKSSININKSSIHINKSSNILKSNKSIECYRYTDETLPDISMEDVRKGKSIFFHETSCTSLINDKIVINSRQACAVESAALMNPNFDVYLTFTSPGVFKFEDTESDRFLEALLSYDNVRIKHLNYEKYTKGTPVEKLYSEGTIEASKYAVEHASDVLRLLTLWKFGGIYLDLDTIVIKSLETLPPNLAGCESETSLGNSILGYSPREDDGGHMLVDEALIDLRDHFDGTMWAYNGPGAVTRLANKHCNVDETKKLCSRKCGNYNIFSIDAFFPIPWQSWKQYFTEGDLEKVMNATENSYIIHVCNHLSYRTKIPIKSTNAYSAFAKKHCPKVFRQCDTYF